MMEVDGLVLSLFLWYIMLLDVYVFRMTPYRGWDLFITSPPRASSGSFFFSGNMMPVSRLIGIERS